MKRDEILSLLMFASMYVLALKDWVFRRGYKYIFLLAVGFGLATVVHKL